MSPNVTHGPLALSRESYAIGHGDQTGIHARIVPEFFVEGANSAGVRVINAGIGDSAIPEGVVEYNQSLLDRLQRLRPVGYYRILMALAGLLGRKRSRSRQSREVEE